jgi:hypothetical protein
VSGNYNEATAQVIDLSSFHIYTGNTATDGMALYNMAWGAPDDPHTCTHNRASTANNVYFTFTVAARTWYHFDPSGSTFSPNYPVLYIYRHNALGGIDWIDCNEYNVFDSIDYEQLPLSLDGVLDPGTYFLIVDGYAGGVGNYVLHAGGMPDGAASGPVAEPNYDEALAAYNAIGGKVIGVDGSGVPCDNSTHYQWLVKNTSGSLEKLVRDTGSLDAGGKPYLLYLDNAGHLCHAGDPAWGNQLADAILGVTAPYRPRSDVSVVVVDDDDATDFDGPPGGTNQLTTPNIDDATFVTSVTTVATPDAMAKCNTIQANQYLGCLGGTALTFNVTFQTPPEVPVEPYDQIFKFVIRIVSNGTTVLSETPVVIVVPAIYPAQHTDAWFVRDFDTTGVCPMGTAPKWSLWAWNASTPSDSKIDFTLQVAPSIAAFSTATPLPTEVPLRFSLDHGPASLVNTAIGVHSGMAGLVDTQFGATTIDSTLQLENLPRDAKVLRMKAHLVPSTDSTVAPVLQTWNLQVDCIPAE